MIYFFRFCLNYSPFYVFFSNDKVVFFPFIILFEFSSFIFCSCVSVCSELFGCVLFGCVAFLFSEVGDSFRFDVFCLSIHGMCDIVLLSSNTYDWFDLISSFNGISTHGG